MCKHKPLLAAATTNILAPLADETNVLAQKIEELDGECHLAMSDPFFHVN